MCAGDRENPLQAGIVSEEVVNELEALVYANLAQRGLDGLEIPRAYLKAAEALAQARRVLILTGFPVRGFEFGETDGPPGAIAAALAFERLGLEVAYGTDGFSKPLLALGTSQLGIQAEILVFGTESETEEMKAAYQRFKPDLVLSIERPGRARDGKCYSMRGESLSDLTPALDPFFDFAALDGYPTLSIGDGGNELGMGTLYDAVIRKVPSGEVIAASTRADILMPATVSNWGAYVLTGLMSILSGRDLLLTEAEASSLLHGMIGLGAVDGATKRREATVDGYSFEENQSVIRSVHEIVQKAIGEK